MPKINNKDFKLDIVKREFVIRNSTNTTDLIRINQITDEVILKLTPDDIENIIKGGETEIEAKQLSFICNADSIKVKIDDS